MADSNFSSNPDLEENKRRLGGEIHQASREAEQLLASGSQALGEGAAALGETAENFLTMAQKIYEDLEEKTLEAAKVTDEAIRKNPYPAVGIAFGVGIIAGLLLRRK